MKCIILRNSRAALEPNKKIFVFPKKCGFFLSPRRKEDYIRAFSTSFPTFSPDFAIIFFVFLQRNKRVASIGSNILALVEGGGGYFGTMPASSIIILDDKNDCVQLTLCSCNGVTLFSLSRLFAQILCQQEQNGKEEFGSCQRKRHKCNKKSADVYLWYISVW